MFLCGVLENLFDDEIKYFLEDVEKGEYNCIMKNV